MKFQVSTTDVRDIGRPFRWISTARIEMEGLLSEADLDHCISRIASIWLDSLSLQGNANLAANGVKAHLSREEGIHLLGGRIRELIPSCTFISDGKAVVQVVSQMSVDLMGQPTANRELWECVCTVLYAWSGSPYCILYDSLALDDKEFIDAKIMLMNAGDLEILSVEDYAEATAHDKKFNSERFPNPNPFEYTFDSDGVAIVNSKWYKPFRLDFSMVRMPCLVG